MFKELTIIASLLVVVFWMQSNFSPGNLSDSLNESSVFGSRAGALLAKHGHIELDKRSMELAGLGLCTGKENLKKPYQAGIVTFYTYIFAETTFEVNLVFEYSDHKIVKKVNANPKRHLYSMNLWMPDIKFDERLSVSLAFSEADPTLKLGSIGFLSKSQNKYEIIRLDGSLGEVFTDLENQLSKPELVEKSMGFLGRSPLSSEVSFEFKVEDELFEFLRPVKFPGLRNSGLCNYQVAKKKELEFNKREWKNKDTVPIVNLLVEDLFLTGERGITKNKELKGRASEVPAQMLFTSNRDIKKQNLGLRFHGGVHRRKPNHLAGYRVYARAVYGNNQIGLPGDIFTNSKEPVKTIVFRSNQAYGHLPGDYKNPERGYNPYNHILSLDIGRLIGANVPRSQLVDFRINGEKKDLYLALDHYSERYFQERFVDKNISIYNYKKYNAPKVVSDYRAIRHSITGLAGERAYERFDELYNVEQVINSILLSAYIGDDDYCQGVDVLVRDTEGHVVAVETFNWDLDHGFVNFDLEEWYSYVDHKRFAFPILKSRGGNCARQRIYKHVYQQSSIFRKMIRDRLEVLLASELTESNLLKLLEKYQHIDWVYFDLKHGDLFRDFHLYFVSRPNEIRNQLDILERWVESRWRWLGEG